MNQLLRGLARVKPALSDLMTILWSAAFVVVGHSSQRFPGLRKPCALLLFSSCIASTSCLTLSAFHLLEEQTPVFSRVDLLSNNPLVLLVHQGRGDHEIC
jgi:hypothetical protein